MSPAGEASFAQEAKRCCAAGYGSYVARLLLGGSYHPGGLALTAHLGTLLDLRPGMRVLDVAAGIGASAIHLAQHTGCHVTGVDLSEANVATAQEAAARAGAATLTRFVVGDAEGLSFPDASFDAVICECAFCTFADKTAAAAEFARVLRTGGRVGLSDLTRQGTLPAELDGLLAWIACIADARPLAEYDAYLRHAGFRVDHAEPHPEALQAMVRQVRARLLGVEVLVELKKLDLPGLDLDKARTMARSASAAAQSGTLGYALLVGTRSAAGQQAGDLDPSERAHTAIR